MKSFLLATFVCCFSMIARADDSSNLVSAADLVGSFPKKKILGPLGRPLGEYMTIEGRPCAVGFGGSVNFLSAEDISKFGVHSLEVDKVDGVEIATPIIISFAQNAKFTPATRYVVRGYQTGQFGPGNPDPKEPNAPLPQTNYQLWIRFVPTKDLTSETTANGSQKQLVPFAITNSLKPGTTFLWRQRDFNGAPFDAKKGFEILSALEGSEQLVQHTGPPPQNYLFALSWSEGEKGRTNIVWFCFENRYFLWNDAIYKTPEHHIGVLEKYFPSRP